jgi:hypothetical protein
MCAELELFKKQHGHCNVPQKWAENPKLGTWVLSQRRARKRGWLSAAQIDRLDDLGFNWAFRASAFEGMYAELERFKERHRHCNVPQEWAENPKLGTWVRTRRDHERAGRLSAVQRARLDELSFDWEPYDAAWMAMLAELTRYKERSGHCNVPRRWVENPELGSWVNTQRTQKNGGKLTTLRKACLDELGFVWDPHQSRWETMFTALKAHRDKYGDCNVPRKHNPALANWMQEQRRTETEGKLSAERKARLDALGFKWTLPRMYTS